MKTTFKIIIGAIAFSTTLAVAQQDNITPSPTKSITSTTTPASKDTISRQEAELLLIKEQNKIMKDFQSSQQATVYWALGGIMSFVIILTGLSIFTNFKFYTQDKERLNKDFDAKLSEYRAELILRMEEYLRDSDKVSEQRNQNLQDRTLNQISEIRSFIESVRSELVTDTKTTNAKILEVDQLLRQRTASVESSLRDVEVLVWDLRGIPSNMLVTHSQAVTTAVETGSEELVSHALNQLKRTLENKFIKTNAPIDEGTYKWLDESLTKASSFNRESTASIRDMLSKLVITKKQD